MRFLQRAESSIFNPAEKESILRYSLFLPTDKFLPLLFSGLLFQRRKRLFHILNNIQCILEAD